MHIHAHPCTSMHIHAHPCTSMHIHAHPCTARIRSDNIESHEIRAAQSGPVKGCTCAHVSNHCVHSAGCTGGHTTDRVAHVCRCDQAPPNFLSNSHRHQDGPSLPTKHTIPGHNTFWVEYGPSTHQQAAAIHTSALRMHGPGTEHSQDLGYVSQCKRNHHLAVEQDHCLATQAA
jgi:hypothetical protein